MNAARLRHVLPLTDGLMAAWVWLVFFLFRKTVIEGTTPLWQPSTYALATGVGLCWVWLLYVHAVYMHSDKLQPVLLARVVLVGVLAVFVLSWLNDPVPSYHSFYYMLGVYGLLQWLALVLTRVALWAMQTQQPTRAILLADGAATVPGTLAAHHFDWLGVVYKQVGQPVNSHAIHDLGTWQQLRGILRMQQRLGRPVDALVLAGASPEDEHYLQLQYIAAQYGARLWVPAALHWQHGIAVLGATSLQATLLPARSPVLDNAYLPLKRSMDVVLSVLLLLALAPLLLLLLLCIQLDSVGPGLYRQLRIGRYGRPFMIWKLRSMVQGAEQRGPLLAMPNDARITRIGRWLRRYHIDELPQLWNVVLGQMSLVGPRPERRYYLDKIIQAQPTYAFVLQLRPGITGWAQIMHGYTRSLAQMLARVPYDRMYVENLSLWLDLRILLHTLRKLVQSRGE